MPISHATRNRATLAAGIVLLALAALPAVVRAAQAQAQPPLSAQAATLDQILKEVAAYE